MSSIRNSAQARVKSPARVAPPEAEPSKAEATAVAKPERLGAFLGSVTALLQLEQKAPAEDAAARAEVARFVAGFDASTLAKLSVLISAGRDAKAIAEALATPATELAQTPLEFDLAAQQNLRRGLAIARATAFDLERAITDWGTSKGAKRGLEDRVWLSFGRELARSNASEWTCLVAMSAGEALDKVYLCHRDGAWWSFGTLVERPSKSEVTRLSGKQPKGRRKLASLPLGAIVPARCRADRSALRRAASALSARFRRAAKPSAR
jgi:hypothetical protein